jgi:hypothetical protein
LPTRILRRKGGHELLKRHHRQEYSA